jgi:Citrate transporter
MLIATEWVHRVAAALGGAVLMLLIGATDAEHAFFSPESGIDWNVIMLLIGMMLIVAVLRRTGLFEYLAGDLGRQTGPRPPVPGDGHLGGHHRGRVRWAGQRHHGAAGRAGDAVRVRQARPTVYLP